MSEPSTPSESRCSLRVGRSFSAFCAALALLAVAAIRAQPAEAQELVINNGLAPPNPDNVIDSSDPDVLTLVRNVDCLPSGSDYWEPCPSPGAPTQVEIIDGAMLNQGGALSGSVVDENGVRDSSSVTMSGGTVRTLSSRETAQLTVTGGSSLLLKAYDDFVLTFLGGGVVAYIEAWDNSTVSIRGGTVGSGGVVQLSSVPVTISGGTLTFLNGLTSAGFLIQGSNFAIDGVPAPYGDYPAAGTRTLTGTWESAEDFSVPFSGPITLAPPAVAVPALLMLPALALAAILLANGTKQIRHRRAA